MMMIYITEINKISMSVQPDNVLIKQVWTQSLLSLLVEACYKISERIIKVSLVIVN